MPILGSKIVHTEGLEPLEAKILDELVDPLISVPRLCSKDYTVVFNKTHVKILDSNMKEVCTGGRDPGEGGLYKLRINSEIELCNNVSEEKVLHMPNLSTYYGGIQFKSKSERVNFYHAALGYPTVACMVAALRSHLQLPGISAADVLNNPPKTEATAKGHLRQHIQGVRSTKPAGKNGPSADSNSPVAVSEGDSDHAPAEEVPQADIPSQSESTATGAEPVSREAIPGIGVEKALTATQSNMYGFTIGKLYADATGKLQVSSVMGDTSVHVTYISSANYIRLRPIKNRSEVNEMLMNNYNEAISKGHKVSMIVTDNEISNHALAFFAKLKVQTSKVEPYNHRANNCERHIQTAKAHIISTLAGRDSECGLENWDKAVSMAELTLSLLRPGTAPGQSSFHSYNGKEYDFNAGPIAPWGAKVQAYVPKALRLSWGYRSKTSFYMGPANYRQHQLREPGAKTPSVRQQVVFMSPDIIYPKYTAADDLRARISDLTTALNSRGSPPDTTLAQALEAYAEAFPTEDDAYPLMQASVVDGDGPAVWVASPIDFAEECAAEFPEVTTVNQSPGSTAEDTVQTVNHSNTLPHSPGSMADNTVQTASPTNTLEFMPEPTIEHANTESSQRKVPAESIPTKEHIPTGAYPTRGAARHGLILDPMAQEKEIDKILVVTEVDHKSLSMRGAMRTENAEDWARADAAELDRFLAIDGVNLISHDELPYGVRARNVVKVLEHKVGKERRVRAAYNGAPVKNEVREEQYSTYSSDHLGKKLFMATLATRSKKAGAVMSTLDISSFYLHERNKLPRVDYMYYDTTHLPNARKSEVRKFVRDNRVLLSCTQAIYGMYDAGSIAGSVLAETLTTNGYSEIDSTCLWTSNKAGEEELLINTNVDDFAIIHVPATGALSRLEKVLANAGYNFVLEKVDRNERFQKFHFCGLDIEHDTHHHTVSVYLGGWAEKILEKYSMQSCKPAKIPYKYNRPVYTGKQAPTQEDVSPPLSKQLLQELQSKIGALNWGAMCVYYNITMAVSKVASKQAHPTMALLHEVNDIIRYISANANTALVFHPSDMKLHTVSDASFTSETKGRSRAGGVFYLGDCNELGHPISSPVEVTSHVIDCVPDSAAEAEYIAVHDVIKRAIYARNILEGLGYPQGMTEHECDNKCAVGIANNTVHDRKTKHIDRRYHWIKHEIKSKNFKVTWKPGKGNIADFYTKYVPSAEHELYANIFTKQYTPSQEGVLGTLVPPRDGA